MASQALVDVCRQFEALFLRSLWPAPQPASFARPDEDAFSAGATDNSHAVVDGLFREAFAGAIAAAGGFGLSAELARKLTGARS